MAGSRTFRTCKWTLRRAARLAALVAVLLPAAAPLPALAQDGPVLLNDAVAVVDETVATAPQEAWIDPATGEAWVDPAAAPVEEAWVDPAAAPAEEWVDPAAAPVEEAWVDPAAAPVDGVALPEAAIAVEEGVAADPNAAPVDPALDPAAAAVETAPEYASEALQVAAEGAPGQPLVPVEQLPAMVPMYPPASTGDLEPDQNWAPPSKVFITQTSQPLGGGFLDVWRQWGGHLSWGYPLTPELQENGVTVQYFSYGRFEYHPNDPNGKTIQFSPLGAATRPFMLRRAQGAAVAPSPAAAETQAWLPVAEEDVPAGARYVPETGHTVSGDLLAFWTQTGEANYLGNPVSEPFKLGGTTYQVFERGRVVQEAGAWPYLQPIGKTMATRWGVSLAPAAQGSLPAYDEALWTPPPAAPRFNVNGVEPPANGERYVLISLSQQYAWAYQGDVVMWQGYVSTGRSGFGTPAGTFHVLTKYEVQTMEGVLGGEYYNVPDVPDVMYFTNQGHALHGAYWHNNFGTPMSHGCVNLPLEVAHWMYDWAPMGMRVTIVP